MKNLSIYRLFMLVKHHFYDDSFWYHTIIKTLSVSILHITYIVIISFAGARIIVVSMHQDIWSNIQNNILQSTIPQPSLQLQIKDNTLIIKNKQQYVPNSIIRIILYYNVRAISWLARHISTSLDTISIQEINPGTIEILLTHNNTIPNDSTILLISDTIVKDILHTSIWSITVNNISKDFWF